MTQNENFGETSKPVTAVPQRSDLVRARRQQRKSSKRSSRSGSLSARSMPPTVTRGMLPAQPGTRRRKEARRRIALPLKSVGAELRLPALPRIKISWRIVSGTMVIALASAIYLLWSMPFFVVRQVKVAGLQMMESWEIDTALQISGQPVFMLDPQLLQEKLQSSFPELSAAEVRVGLPARVTVNVSERTPLIFWKQSEVEAWVDAEGVAFPPRGELEGLVKVKAMDVPPTLPTEDGLTRLIMPEMVQAILTLQTRIPEGHTIIYHPEYGLGWNDPGGWKVYFGQRPEDMEVRLAIYQALVEMLQKRKLKPTIVSVEYIHAPYYRLQAEN